jgi:hypothetical protein
VPRGKRGPDRPGDFFDGTVLLRCTPLPGVAQPKAGLPGLAAAFDCFDDVETLRRRPLTRRTFSGVWSPPPLASDGDRQMALRRLLCAGGGVAGAGVGVGAAANVDDSGSAVAVIAF